MQKLNRRQLRILIESEAKTMDEGLESALTSVVGAVPVIGDAIAAIKAGTWDVGSLVKDSYDLSNALAPYGMTSIAQLTAESAEFDQVLAQVAGVAQEEKLAIKDHTLQFMDSVKDMIVSLVSIIPDGVISGPVAFGLANLPVEQFILDGAGLIQSLREQIEKLPGGSMLWSAIMMSLKVSSGGPMALFMGNPVETFANLGKLSNAIDGSAAAGTEVVTAELVTESRWLKIAGIL